MPVDLQKLLLKQKIISLTRDYFIQKNFQEITTPVLNSALPLEQNIYSLSTTWQQSQDKLYLATSPESSLKKLIAAGLGDCFSISSCFRDLEAKSPTHLPEFLMLEWYQTNKNYLDVIQFCQDLIINICHRLDNSKTNGDNILLIYQNHRFDLTPPWPQISLPQLFLDHASLDLSANLDLSALSKSACQKGYSVSPTDTWESIFNQIFLNEVEPHLPNHKPVFLTDYPCQISPLAQPQPNHPGLAQRFELYFGSLEVANGNTENRNPADLTKASVNEDQYRLTHKLPSHPIDSTFIDAVSHLPDPTAGCGLGLDRLAMLLTNTPDISSISLSAGY